MKQFLEKPLFIFLILQFRRSLISESILQPKDNLKRNIHNNEFTVKKEDLFTVFKINETNYRIGGLKPLFVTSLKVNIRADNGKVSYYDSIDLYISRGRTSFAQGLFRTWGISPECVEADLIRILEYLEKERDERLLSKSKTYEKELSEEEKILGMNFLRDKNLFNRIINDMSVLGYVGEEINKLLLYLCASSRKLDNPINVLIISQSASGKSFLIDTIKHLIPPKEVITITSFSEQALNYIDNLMHKFVIFGEAVHSELIEYQIREIISSKELNRLVTIRNPDTGKMQSEIVCTPIIISSVMTGTNNSINPENASRFFIVNTDESIEQTKRIHENQKNKYSLERLKRGNEEQERIIKTHRAAQKLLQKVNIVNDIAPFINFPVKLMRTRRDHDRFMDLMASICFLRQFQKELEYEDGISFIRCDLEDYSIAYKIMVDGILSSTMRELSSGAQILYEHMRTYARKMAKKHGMLPTEISMTQRQLREYTGQSNMSVKNGIKQLIEFEYIDITKGGQERSKGFYRIKKDEDINKLDYSMLPSPKEMKEIIEKHNQLG